MSMYVCVCNNVCMYIRIYTCRSRTFCVHNLRHEPLAFPLIPLRFEPLRPSSPAPAPWTTTRPRMTVFAADFGPS